MSSIIDSLVVEDVLRPKRRPAFPMPSTVAVAALGQVLGDVHLGAGFIANGIAWESERPNAVYRDLQTFRIIFPVFECFAGFYQARGATH